MTDTWLTGRKKKLVIYLPPGYRKVSVRIAESSSVGLVLSRSSVLYLPSLLRCVVVATAFYTGFLLVVTALVAVQTLSRV